MLFTAKINELNAHIETNQATITELEGRIEALREENNRIASQCQAMLSAESACESAIAQLGVALQLTAATDPTMVQTLKDAALAVFNQDAALLAPEPELSHEADDDDQEDGSIEVEVVSDETIDYNALRVAELRSLCRQQGLDHRGNKADLIARLEGLKGGQVSASEDDYPMAA